MPKASLQGPRGPNNVSPGQAILDARVVGNVEVIIQINELIVLDRGIDNESRHDQEQSGDPLLVISKGAQSSHLPGLELLQIGARFRVVGVAFDSLLKVLDRLLKISFLSQHRSQINDYSGRLLKQPEEEENIDGVKEQIG